MKVYDVQSDKFLDVMKEFFGQEESEIFIHELVAFARSPLGVIAYDSTVQYP